MDLKNNERCSVKELVNICRSEFRLPTLAMILFCINGIVLLLSFNLSNGQIKSEWLLRWGIIPQKPQFPQCFTYCLLHFHFAHFLGTSFLIIIAGVYGEWRIGKKLFLCFYILGATIIAWFSIVVLKIFLHIAPHVVVFQWFGEGLNGHMVGSSAAAFGVYGGIYPKVGQRLRSFYFLLLTCALLGPIVVFQSINIGDWAHLFVYFFSFGISILIFNRERPIKNLTKLISS
ncbi:MAG: rhomboid family intramembrane serine protease [Promethearchaeota archaeon]